MANYNLIFQGEIIAGASLEEVKANVARLFKADAAKTAALFSGKTIIIKRNLDSDSARKYLAILKKAGAVVKAVKIETEPAQTSEQSREATPAPASGQPSSSKPSARLSSGLASLISYNQAVRNDETVQNDKTAQNNEAVNNHETARSDKAEEEGLQLAPLGSNIPNLHNDNETIIIPDLSYLTMSEAESGSLEEFAQKPEPVILPDISGLSMSAANEGSLEEFAARPEPVPLPDTSMLDIAEQDDTPLSSESPKTAPLAVPDISQLSMSEAQEGSLEGLEQKPEPAEIPDISHLSMEEPVTEENIQGKAVFQISD